MSTKKGKIGVLTSGGDAPGMNAAIRAVVRTGITRGYDVYGIRRGYNGILHREMDLLTFKDVSEKLQHGGTFLFTARSAEFREIEGKKKAAEICKEMGIETLIVIGGDGSFTGAKNLSKFGVLFHYYLLTYFISSFISCSNSTCNISSSFTRTITYTYMRNCNR